MEPFVSIIMLNYNGKKNLGPEFLRQSIRSVLNSKYSNFEVIYFDNGSTDRSAEFLENTFGKEQRLKIIHNGKNFGFSEGNNLALKYADGEYIVLLNNDVQVEPYWLSELVKVINSDFRIGAAQSKILSLDRTHIQTAGNLLDVSLNTYLIGSGQKDEGQYNQICEITFPCGASVILRRSLLEKIGLFDANYFFYHDDCDLGWRVKLAGYKVVSVPSSIVYHKGGATSESTFRRNQGMYFLLSSKMGLLIKNLDYKHLFRWGKYVLISMEFDLIGLLLHKEIKILFRFVNWIFHNFGYNWKQRVLLQRSIRKLPDNVVLTTFLDSSIFSYRFYRNVGRFYNSRFYDDFEKLVLDATDKYYKKHIYERL